MDIRVDIEPAFLTQAEVARLLGVPEWTLEGWRLARVGPPCLKLGRHVKYDRDEVGQVQVTRLANGKWWARARMRDDAGELVQLRAEGPTEDAARTEVLSRARTLTTHTKTLVSRSSIIAETAASWLPTVRVRAENGQTPHADSTRGDHRPGARGERAAVLVYL